MKYNKDNLITVGIINLIGLSLDDLSAILSEHFAYYEILIVANALDQPVDTLEDSFNKYNNIRCILLNGQYPREILEFVVLEQAIGDLVVLFDPSTDPVYIPIMAAEILGGADFMALQYEGKFFSIYGILSWFYGWLIYLITGARIPSNLSNSVAISRRITSTINESSPPHRYLKLMNTQLAYKTKILRVKDKQPKITMNQLMERISLGMDVLSSASPRLIKFASVLSLLCAILNGLYLFYVAGVYILLPDVQKGWTTTSLVLATMFCILFFVLSVIGATAGNILRQSMQMPTYGVAHEFSSSEIIYNINQKNVES